MIEERDSLTEILHKAAYEDVAPAEDFNGQIIRRARMHRRARSLEVLSPLLIGAAAAAIGLVALLQVVSQPVAPVKLQSHHS